MKGEREGGEGGKLGGKLGYLVPFRGRLVLSSVPYNACAFKLKAYRPQVCFVLFCFIFFLLFFYFYFYFISFPSPPLPSPLTQPPLLSPSPPLLLLSPSLSLPLSPLPPFPLQGLRVPGQQGRITLQSLTTEKFLSSSIDSPPPFSSSDSSLLIPLTCLGVEGGGLGVGRCCVLLRRRELLVIFFIFIFIFYFYFIFISIFISISISIFFFNFSFLFFFSFLS